MVEVQAVAVEKRIRKQPTQPAELDWIVELGQEAGKAEKIRNDSHAP